VIPRSEPAGSASSARPVSRARGGAGVGGCGEPAEGSRDVRDESARRRGPRADQDPATRAREICLHQLAARPRSRNELAGKLRRSGVDEDVAEAVLNRLTEVGLIDDAAFASMVVSSARTGRGLGRRGLAHELSRRGVDAEVSAAALADVDDDSEEASARALVARRLPSLAAAAPPVRARRLAALLARKGYSGDVARNVLNEMLGETEANDDLGPGDADIAPDPTDG
jgi:regulatory protein